MVNRVNTNNNFCHIYTQFNIHHVLRTGKQKGHSIGTCTLGMRMYVSALRKCTVQRY